MDKKIKNLLKQIDINSKCIIDVKSENTFTYSQFHRNVNKMASYFAQNYGDELLIRENNTVELMTAYFAAMVSGKKIVPIDPEKETDEVNSIRRLHDKAFFFDIGELALIISNDNKTDYSEIIDWESVDFSKEYLVTYTSGSTGEPKGVCHTVKNLFWSAYDFGMMMGYDDTVVMGHCMPMTYMAGILNTILMPYLFGGCVAILSRFSMTNAFSFWKMLEKGGVNTIWLSPTMLRIVNMLDKKAEMKEYFHKTNIQISVGTAPLDKKLREDFENKYLTRLYQSYGLSETLFISTEVPEEKISAHTVGRVLPSVNLEYEKDGEILISTPWMFERYTNADTASYMMNEAYKSGDIGEIENENLLITGRKKDLIVKGGYNVNPRDIENCVIEKGLADECAVVSVTVSGEEMIVCCVVVSSEVTLKEINVSVEQNLGKHCRVDYLEKIPSLPKNLNGKIDKPTIKELMRKKYADKD